MKVVIVKSTLLKSDLVRLRAANREVQKSYTAPKRLLDEVIYYYHQQEKLEQKQNNIFVKAKSVLKNTWKYLTGKIEEPFNELVIDELSGGYAFAITQQKRFLSIQESEEFIRYLQNQGLNINTQSEYIKFVQAAKEAETNNKLFFEFNGQKIEGEALEKAQRLQSNPLRSYKNKGWKSWGVFLGTDSIAPQNKQFLPFKMAKDLIAELKDKDIVINSRRKYTAFVRAAKEAETNNKLFFEFSGQKIEGEALEKAQSLPTDPTASYQDDWEDWYDFLGTIPKAVSNDNSTQKVEEQTLKADKSPETTPQENQNTCNLGQGTLGAFLEVNNLAVPYISKSKLMNLIVTNYLMAKTQTVLGKNESVTILNLGSEPLAERLDSPATLKMDGTLRNWLKQNKGIQQINTIDFDHISEPGNVAADVFTMTSNLVKKNSADLAIFSLSLRGENIDDYLIQACKALKQTGKLLIADHKNVFNSNERDILQKRLKDLGFTNLQINEIGDYFFILATVYLEPKLKR